MRDYYSMIGLKTEIKGRNYRIPDFVVLNLNLEIERLVIEGSGYIFSSQRIEEGITYEFVISRFDQPSEKLSDSDLIIDNNFEDWLFSKEHVLQRELKTFRHLETFLKSEGKI